MRTQKTTTTTTMPLFFSQYAKSLSIVALVATAVAYYPWLSRKAQQIEEDLEQEGTSQISRLKRSRSGFVDDAAVDSDDESDTLVSFFFRKKAIQRLSRLLLPS
jgi:hypothetical protein